MLAYTKEANNVYEMPVKIHFSCILFSIYYLSLFLDLFVY